MCLLSYVLARREDGKGWSNLGEFIDVYYGRGWTFCSVAVLPGDRVKISILVLCIKKCDTGSHDLNIGNLYLRNKIIIFSIFKCSIVVDPLEWTKY